GDRRAVSPLVELMDHTGAVRPDDLHRQAEPAANGPQFASVGAGGGDDPAVLVVEERGGVSQRVGAGEQVAVGVVGEAGGVAERVGGGDHPAAVVDQVAGRVSGGGGEGGGAVAGVRVGFGVGQGDLDVAGFAAFCDDAVAVVVDVVVAAAVGVDPGGDAPAVVVDERGGRAGGFGDGGEVAVLVIAVGHEWQVGAVLAPAGQVECGDQAVGGGQLQLMAGRVDQGRGQSVGGAVDGDGVAVAFGDAGQPGGSVATGFGVGRGGEAAGQSGVGVGGRVVAVRVAGQQGAGGAGLGTGGGAGGGVRIRDQQPVGRDVDDADRVDLQALVDGGGPGRPQETAGRAARLGAAGEHQRQDAGNLHVRLRQEHTARGEVDRVGAVGRAVSVRPVVGAVGRVVDEPAHPGRVGRVGGDAHPLDGGATPARGHGQRHVRQQTAEALVGVLHEVADHLLAGADRVVGGQHQPRGQAVEAGGVLGRVGQVVRVEGVDAAHEVEQPGGALDDAAADVVAHDLQLLQAVAELLRVRRLLRRHVPGRAHRCAGRLGRGVALLAGLGQDLLRLLHQLLARVVER